MAIIAGLGFLSSVLDKKEKDEGILKVDLSQMPKDKFGDEVTIWTGTNVTHCLPYRP